ncbi:phospholipase YtpA [Pullulanibacillus camelliae]|uniref:Phospholipase YtpA n=1 Tax=Pullulanibacillus camelliae TaxID=1707096 RepID=A0A8J3DXU6_9BACL|nr:alpha/beta hydrolase [Pullulanibacillus camelliae]GGE48976.1 phospholipase YtpA [Pullulanibacillus camelliae]
MWVWKTALKVPKGVIVIVHGAGEHHGRYEWLKRQWLKAGYHVILGDLPGQGKNAEHRGHVDSFNEYIVTLRKWIDKARTFKLPYVVFGHSLGGLVVIRTLQESRLRPDAVVLSSPCLGLKVPPPSWLKKAVSPFNLFVPRFRIPIKRSGENVLATHNKEILERDALDPLIVKKISLRWYFELDLAMEKAFQRMDRFPDVPLFILQAGNDKIVDKTKVYEWFHKIQLRNKQYKEWPGFYHEVFNEPERDVVFHYLLHKLTPFL